MIGFIIAILVAASSAQETAILLSGFPTTKIVAGFSSVNDRGFYMNISYLEEDPIGNGSQWVYPREYFGSPLLKPAGFTVVYQALFYSTCSLKVGLLRIGASSQFVAYLDGKEVARGEGWNNIKAISVPLHCGFSNLTVFVTNKQRGPCAVTFSVSQDQTKCFECTDVRLPFFNQNTCKCECSNSLNNSTCGSTCPSTANACNSTQIFNIKTCKCECKKTICGEGFIQDSLTCRVFKKECKIRRCIEGFYWNSQECQCLINPCRPVSQPMCKNGFSYFICSCIQFVSRPSLLPVSQPSPTIVSITPSPNTSSSQCIKQQCVFPFVWTESSCSCKNILISTNMQT